VKKLDGPSLSKPPEADEIEVSVFGPGFGESIVAHLTRGAWITVDSCLDKETLSPAARELLRNRWCQYSARRPLRHCFTLARRSRPWYRGIV
jgi:hypothetical protein